MCCVTLLVSGVPHNVPLTALSYNLNILFNTDDIGIFELRELPVHPWTNKRQIALDFPSGFDAIAAQEKLNGNTYVMANGQEYRLSAKINRLEEHARPTSPIPERAGRWDDEVGPLAVIPNVSDEDMVRAHAKLDAQLEILNKHKLILETEQEILKVQRKLKREYRLMHGFDSGTESKRSRSGSLEQPSSSSHSRSRSREHFMHPQQSCGYTLPELPWHEERERIRDLRSHSKERYSCSRSRERDRWGRSSRSDGRREDWRSDERHYRSRSRERVHTNRSLSRESYRDSHLSAQELKQFRDSIVAESRSNVSYVFPKKRSRSKRARPLSVMPKSPEKPKSPDSRPRTESTVTKKCGGNPQRNSISDTREHIDGNRNNINKDAEINALIDNTQAITPEQNNERNNATEVNGSDKTDKEWKPEQLEEKVESITNDVMFLVLILLEEICVKDQIEISKADKLLFDKKLVEIVKARVEPLARVKTNRDIDILRQYKALYPRQDDLSMLKAMLDKIPRIVETENNEQENNSEADIKRKDKNESIIARLSNTLNGSKNIDLVSDVTKQSTETDSRTDDKWDTALASVGNKENAPRMEVEKEVDEEIVVVDSDNDTASLTKKDAEGTTHEFFKTYQESVNILKEIDNKNNIPRIDLAHNKVTQALVIDLDSAEKPKSHFVLGLKKLLKEYTKLIEEKNLIDQIPILDLKYVLTDILRRLTKGQANLSNKEIIKKFRNIHPKEEDENFIKTIIQDLKDGKYPGLTSIEENDCDDDVILIETKYDVITVEDSDDDTNDLKPLNASLEMKSEEATAQTEFCSSDASASIQQYNPGTSESYSDLVKLGRMQPGQIIANPIPSIPVPISTIIFQNNPESSGFKASKSVQSENSQPRSILNNPNIPKPGPDHPSPIKISVYPVPSVLKPNLHHADPGKEMDNSATKLKPVLPSPNKVTSPNPEPTCLKPTYLDPNKPGKLMDICVTKLKPAISSQNKVTPPNPDPSCLKPTLLDRTESAKEMDNSVAKLKPALPSPNKVTPPNPEPTCLKQTYLHQIKPGKEMENSVAELRPALPSPNKVIPPNPEPTCLKPIYRDPNKPGKEIDNSVAKQRPALPSPNKVTPPNPEPNCLKQTYLDPAKSGIKIDNSVAKLRPVLPSLTKVTPENAESSLDPAGSTQSRWNIRNPSAKLPTHTNQPKTVTPEPCLKQAQIRPTQANANIKVKLTPNQIQLANPKPSCSTLGQIPTQPKAVTDVSAAKSSPTHLNPRQVITANQKPSRFTPQSRPISATNIPSPIPYRPTHFNPMQIPLYPRPVNYRPNLTQLRPAYVPSQRPYNPNGPSPRPAQPKKKKKKNKVHIPQIRPQYPNSFQGFPPNEPFWFGPVVPLLDQLGPSKSSQFVNNPTVTKIKGAYNPITEKTSGIGPGKEDAHLQSRKENGDIKRETKRETSKENVVEKSGGLKVTEITAITDNDKPKTVIPIENIKEEKEDEAFQSKMADPGPRVTSITIMTSDTELFSLGNENNEPKKVKDENLYDETEATNDSGINIDDVVNGIDCTDGGGNNSNRSLDNVDGKNNVPQDNAASDVEDETIESIIKFVQSLV